MNCSFSSKLSIILLLITTVSILFFSGCATEPVVDPQITSSVKTHHVPQVTANKVAHGQHLNYNDIENLVEGGVPTYITVGYLRSTEAIYNLDYAQLHRLRNKGASPELLNYLTETQGFYGKSRPAKSRIPKYIRDNSILNQDKQPFFYNEPIIDDWYDSAYEESCYSPFSFNGL